MGFFDRFRNFISKKSTIQIISRTVEHAFVNELDYHLIEILRIRFAKKDISNIDVTDRRNDGLMVKCVMELTPTLSVTQQIIHFSKNVI